MDRDGALLYDDAARCITSWRQPCSLAPMSRLPACSKRLYKYQVIRKGNNRPQSALSSSQSFCFLTTASLYISPSGDTFADISSAYGKTTRGVFQGSFHIGSSAIFVVYFNDIQNCYLESCIKLFADVFEHFSLISKYTVFAS